MSDLLLSARLNDAKKLCDTKCIPKFLGFLSADELSEIKPQLNLIKHRIFGGYEYSERSVVAVLPEWSEGEDNIFPIAPITFRYRESDILQHKDFLGSVMALGIKRSTVGDILIGKGIAVMFVLEEISEYIISQIYKVGSVGVKISKGMPETLPGQSEFIEGSCTIASTRLDCVVAALGKCSRNQAVEKIISGIIILNSVVCDKGTSNVKNGDVLTIRKVGKFIIESVDSRSKKGRVILKFKKYK